MKWYTHRRDGIFALLSVFSIYLVCCIDEKCVTICCLLYVTISVDQYKHAYILKQIMSPSNIVFPFHTHTNVFLFVDRRADSSSLWYIKIFLYELTDDLENKEKSAYLGIRFTMYHFTYSTTMVVDQKVMAPTSKLSVMLNKEEFQWMWGGWTKSSATYFYQKRLDHKYLKVSALGMGTHAHFQNLSIRQYSMGYSCVRTIMDNREVSTTITFVINTMDMICSTISDNANNLKNVQSASNRYY